MKKRGSSKGSVANNLRASGLHHASPLQHPGSLPIDEIDTGGNVVAVKGHVTLAAFTREEADDEGIIPIVTVGAEVGSRTAPLVLGEVSPLPDQVPMRLHPERYCRQEGRTFIEVSLSWREETHDGVLALPVVQWEGADRL
jgi:hypothetical protein